MDKQWLIDFWNAYDECAGRGKADSPGGAEFRRVLTTALSDDISSEDFTSFIEREAGAVPPSS